MRKIAIYGKGGIGKSTITSNLSLAYADDGKKVLQIGCDPKKDSCVRLLDGKKIDTVLDLMHNIDSENYNFVVKGARGIDCIESGGPKAGVGCAGRGISHTFEIIEDSELLEKKEYDVVMFDVLGDVVCGGFAAPLRQGFSDLVLIVISEEIMSLYAANNIIHAIKTYESNGIYLGGLILNVRDNNADLTHVKKFVKMTNTSVLSVIPRTKLMLEAEKENKTIMEKYPASKSANAFKKLSSKLLYITKEKAKYPHYLSEEEFNSIFKQ